MDPVSLFPAGYVASRVIGMAVDVAVGLHPWERHPERPNRLTVDVEMFAAPGDGIVDYDPVRDLVRGWSARPHVEWLETLAEELLAHCFAEPRVMAVRVRVMKRTIFAEAEGAGIEVFRTRA